MNDIERANIELEKEAASRRHSKQIIFLNVVALLVALSAFVKSIRDIQEKNSGFAKKLMWKFDGGLEKLSEGQITYLTEEAKDRGLLEYTEDFEELDPTTLPVETQISILQKSEAKIVEAAKNEEKKGFDYFLTLASALLLWALGKFFSPIIEGFGTKVGKRIGSIDN